MVKMKKKPYEIYIRNPKLRENFNQYSISFMRELIIFSAEWANLLCKWYNIQMTAPKMTLVFPSCNFKLTEHADFPSTKGQMW